MHIFILTHHELKMIKQTDTFNCMNFTTKSRVRV